ncbi:transcription factor [Ganoderma sinense ZZ0214-1]|uniref:Transcription factor n=1 Tax=Ganoderma sinense ZZ0214-1 TaxID=1077348 RepID=A0A2G8RW13_9APHY|nr:transcription factor [Ganoderma sinense ZZ0214-1]
MADVAPPSLLMPPALRGGLRIILGFKVSLTMPATSYHVPNPLHPQIESCLAGSLSQANPYASPSQTWQQHVPAPSQDEWTPMPVYQSSSCTAQPMAAPYVDNSAFVPEAKDGGSNHHPPRDAPEHAPGYIRVPAHCSLDQDAESTPDRKSSGRSRGAGASVKPGRKRARAARQTTAKRTGACARCRRLKMKCTFAKPEDEVCSRCAAGAYELECVFPGRKPRAPAMRVVLRQQIRDTDAMIDSLLSRVNPGPTMATPLTLVPARLPLSSEERTSIEYRSILTYLERATQRGGQRFDISALEDIPSEDDSDADSDMENVASAASPVRGSSAERAVQPVDSILEVMAPVGIMATAALQSSRAAASAVPDDSSSDSGHSHESKGVASENYFLPGPQTNLQLRRLIVERQAAPDILLSGLVTPEDVTALFEIHYKCINPILPILDENIHSPASVLARCPFLFTVICTVASRYYKEKPHIYGMAIHFAKAAAANAVIDGWKTVEMCQAFALWSVYNPPARRWEEDRAWCYTGIAFRLTRFVFLSGFSSLSLCRDMLGAGGRLATELNLSRIPEPFVDERQERESHNRTRMWLMCFVIDHCLSIHSGKAWMVQEDATIRNVASWLHNFKYHNQCDRYLASLAELLTIVSRFVAMVNPAFRTSSVASVDNIDFATLYKDYDDELLAWKAVIDERHRGEKKSSDPAVVMRITLIYCVFHYCRLVICCYGMQTMSKNKAIKPDELIAGCLQAATSLVKLMVEDFVPSGFVPYSPELVFTLSAFATAVLFKCLRPEYNAYLDIQQEERIIELVQRLFTVWTSDKLSSLDECHNTQLYAKFLKQLMEPHVARLTMKKRAASVSDRNAAPHALPAAAQTSSAHEVIISLKSQTPAGREGRSNAAPSSVMREHPLVSHTAYSGSSGSAARYPVFPHHVSTAAAAGTSSQSGSMEHLYATDVDITKEASHLAAASGTAVHSDVNAENVSWEQLMAVGSSLGGGFGDALGGMMGGGGPTSTAGSGPQGNGAIDWNGMLGDEYFTAMTGLGEGTWFLTHTASHGGS